jgi:hypothetical protein
MQAAVALYGWLACKFENSWLRILTVMLLSSIGFSLLHLGYHDLYDVLGGIFFAALSLWAYNFILSKARHSVPWLNIFVATCFMLYIYIRYDQIIAHVWLAYYTLIGFILSAKIFEQKIELKSITHRVLATILCFLAILIIQSIFQSHILNDLPIYLAQLKWLLVGISIPCSNFSSKIIMEIISDKH